MLTPEEMKASLTAASETVSVELDGVAFPLTICKVSMAQYRQMREACRMFTDDGDLVLGEDGEPEVDMLAVAAHLVAAGTVGLDLTVGDVAEWPVHRVFELSDRIAVHSRLGGDDAEGEAAGLARTFPVRDAGGESDDNEVAPAAILPLDTAPVGRVDTDGVSGSGGVSAGVGA